MKYTIRNKTSIRASIKHPCIKNNIRVLLQGKIRLILFMGLLHVTMTTCRQAERKQGNVASCWKIQCNLMAPDSYIHRWSQSGNKDVLVVSID